MRSGWIATRPAKILLLGICLLLLHQVLIPYRFTLAGEGFPSASLAHLRTGFLLAIAMLERDRIVLAACVVMDFCVWLIHGLGVDYPVAMLAIAACSIWVVYAWLCLCARWMGWPREPALQRVSSADVLRFAVIGLLLFPLGYVAINLVMFMANRLLSSPMGWVDAFSGVLPGMVQIYFAKYFGVAVVTLPLVVAWTERKQPAPHGGRRTWMWLLVLTGVLLASILLTRMIKAGIVDSAGLVLMDYRLVLIAVVGWCMLNLRLPLAMLLFSGMLFMLVRRLAEAAEFGGSLIGSVNLAHLALEVGIVLVGMLYYSLSARDRRELQKRIVEDAHRDSITGLPNYNALRAQPEARQGRAGEVGYLLLDQADAVAVGFGLQAQASVMGAVAARLADSVRPYYLGTGQFALLPDGESAYGAWGPLLASVERMEHMVEGRRVRMTPYMGVVAFGRNGEGDVEYALMSASNLAYEARRRNEVKPLYADVSHSILRHEEQRRLHDTADAIASLRAGRLLLYFQAICPIEGAGTDRTIRGEVLCRLLGEDGSVIAPDRFVDAIEASRRGPELDLAVVAALFRVLRAHPDAIDYCESISVNLTGQSLSSDGFRARLESLLRRSPLPLSRLCFEITETAAISNREAASRFLQGLREKGCRIAIDDFGAGMQSFSRLRDLPFDVIKIDGSFVRNMLEDHRDFEVVQASVSVARANGAEVVAEFVENSGIAQQLHAMGVRWGQGYLYARPLPLDEVLAAAEG